MRMFGFIIWGLAAITAGYTLFYVSYQVEALEQELASLNRQILKEQETVHILEAEWSYLTRPDRLQKLSNDLLPDLLPMTAAQFTSFDEIPFRPEMTEGEAPNGKPKIRPMPKPRRISHEGDG